MDEKKQERKITYENVGSQKLNEPLTEPFAFAVSPAKVYLDTLGNGSRRTMREALQRCAGLLICGDIGTARAPAGCNHDRNGNPLTDPLGFRWHQLTRDDIAALRAALDARYAPNTANKMLAALRGVLREAWRLGLLDAETMHRLADIQNIPGEALPAGRMLTQAEVRALFNVCAADARPQGIRDAAILALLIGCGLRRAEVCALDRSDYQDGSLTIRGKRNKRRTAHPPAGTGAALADWLDIRGDEAGALFHRINKGGKVETVRLSEQAIYEMLWRRAGQAATPKLSPHDCRRTFISNLLDSGVDISTTQRMAGHSNVTTTTRYDRRPEEAKRKAAQTVHIPYRSRKR